MRARLDALGSDKLVDAGAQIVQLKILIRRRLAVVDFLRPLLEGHFDPECLVDRKGDIEKIQAVDAEIVDGVAFRFDRVARNIASLGDDIGYRVKGRRHRMSRISHAFCTGSGVFTIAGGITQGPHFPCEKPAARIAKTWGKFNGAANTRKYRQLNELDD